MRLAEVNQRQHHENEGLQGDDQNVEDRPDRARNDVPQREQHTRERHGSCTAHQGNQTEHQLTSVHVAEQSHAVRNRLSNVFNNLHASCPAVLRYCIKETEIFRVRGFHTVSLTFPESFRYISVFSNSSGHPHAALQPRLMRFRLLRVRSPLLAESLLISVPGLLRWFTSPSLALLPYFIQTMQCTDHSVRVTPFGYLRINGYVLLPAAYRSLSRPSSPYSSYRHSP